MYNYNLGEEIILESHRIPWLILIQLIVLLLLILLLSYFGLFSLDLAGAAVSAPPSKISSAVIQPEAGGGSQERQEETQIERATGSEGNGVSERSSQKDFHRFIHPCYYLDLAKKAFFQCLGLGSTPSNPRERTNDE